MERDHQEPKLSLREHVLQGAFYRSGDGFREMAKIAGAAIVIRGEGATIGAEPRPPITEEDNPRLFKAYQDWIAKTGRG